MFSRETLKRNLIPGIFLKMIFKRRNSNEIGINLKNLAYEHRNIRMRQTNLKTHRVNLQNFSKYKLGEHYQLANSLQEKNMPIYKQQIKASMLTEKNNSNFIYNKKFLKSKPNGFDSL